MPRSQAFVGNITEVATPGSAESAGRTAAGDLASVTLESGRSARLISDEPRAATWVTVLDDLRRAGLPVYLEVEAESGAVTEVLVPLRVTVEELSPGDDEVEVELMISQARHVLRRNNPDFDDLLGTLEQALAEGRPVLVTETLDGAEIVDVRLLPKDLPMAAVSRPEPEAEAGVLAVSPGQAGQMFALSNAQTCCSSAPSAPCVPFTFPDDGCWGRAHEMVRLMRNAGGQPEKIWIYGQLRVATANHPSCEVRWNWHVAPVLRVDTGTGPQTYVVDPALFNAPVPQATWVGVQGDPAARTVITSADVFHRSSSGSVVYDPSYAETNVVLARYRAQLQLRSASSDGPPPYPQCAPRPPGVQWIGTLAPNESRRWFTFGWPAGWHIVWTVMPLTICPGSPQLRWSVAVERADSGRATYWVTVSNLTSRTVRFEGRYDVLSR